MKIFNQTIEPFNTEYWFLFQLFDRITERWSPVYCAPTLAAAHLECRDLSKKRPNQVFVFVPLGTISDGVFVPSPSQTLQFGELEEETDEVPTT